MALALKYKATVKNAGLDAITTAIGASGLLRIYDGTKPTNPDTALSGNTLLAELPLSATSAPAASGGVLTFNAITTANAVATSTATWGSFLTSAGVRVVDGTVGTSGSDINLSSTSIVSGNPVSISSATITAGN